MGKKARDWERGWSDQGYAEASSFLWVHAWGCLGVVGVRAWLWSWVEEKRQEVDNHAAGDLSPARTRPAHFAHHNPRCLRLSYRLPSPFTTTERLGTSSASRTDPFHPFPLSRVRLGERARHPSKQQIMATFWSRLWDKTKKDPLIPIGCTATLGCLGAGLYAFKSGEVRTVGLRSGKRGHMSPPSFSDEALCHASHHPRPHALSQKHLSQKMMRARVLAQGFTIAVLMAGKDRTCRKCGRGGMKMKMPACRV